MQFRERAKVIQLIRTVYDPAIKRGRAEVVGKLDKDFPLVDDALRRACSPAELVEIETYLAQRRQALTQESMAQAARELPAMMRMAEHYFLGGGDPLAGTNAAEIFAAWDDLKKALHKSGYRKEKRGD
ncbi:MAG: hypothetical protein HYU59_04240 [Magnetospirillum gryphiswaldense]|nr:hypothetical protein [Magnetospirillum gryphiswaldense]